MIEQITHSNFFLYFYPPVERLPNHTHRQTFAPSLVAGACIGGLSTWLMCYAFMRTMSVFFLDRGLNIYIGAYIQNSWGREKEKKNEPGVSVFY